MVTEDDVRYRTRMLGGIVKTISNHGLGATSSLLIRLEEHNKCALPVLPRLVQRLRSSHHHRNMHVMPTSVHHRFLHSILYIDFCDRTRILQTRQFSHWQGISICAQKHSLAFPIPEYANQASAPNVRSYVKASQGPQKLSCLLRGAEFLE
jgi:hypothetical protein